jgi:hypothetical protein
MPRSLALEAVTTSSLALVPSILDLEQSRFGYPVPLYLIYAAYKWIPVYAAFPDGGYE